MYYLILFLSFLSLQAEIEPVSVLKQKQPYWHNKVIEKGEGGKQTVLLFDGDEPVKELSFDIEGRLKNETDVKRANGIVLAHGPSVLYSESSKIESMALYYEGKLHGEMSSFYPNGLIEHTVYYVMGKKSGEEKGYYDNGKIAFKRHYKDGLPSGEWETYFEKGGRQSLKSFEKGVLQGLKEEWNDKGELVESIYYLNGLPHSQKKVKALSRYYEGGRVRETQEFLFGLPHGDWIQYYPDGAISFEAYYVMGELKGLKKATTHRES